MVGRFARDEELLADDAQIRRAVLARPGEPAMTRLCVCLLLVHVALAQSPAWPGMDARAAGLSPERLEQVRANLAQQRTDALLVVRRGRIVLEWYAPKWDAARPHGTASLAKALVGGLSLLIATDEGRISAGDLAARYIPAWRSDPRKSKITIRALATHTSGLEDAEQDHIPHMELPGWKGAFWRRQPDPFSVAIHDTPVVYPPGQGNAYSNPGMAALGYAITASLRETAHPNLKLVLRDRITRPLGIPDAEWDIGYGQAYEVDGLPLYATWGGGTFSTRAAGRIGLWLLQRGAWRGKRLLAPSLIDRMVADAGMPLQDRHGTDPAPRSGLGWWVNTDGIWPGVPRDVFVGAGAGHQMLIVIPSLDLVIVRFGQALEGEGAAGGFWGPIYRNILEPMMAAVETRGAYPASPDAVGVKFAPKFAIRCLAPGSDNWPLTWGDDGSMYTAYGDGRGFSPFTERKLSLGLAKIHGNPADFRGQNVRSESGQRTGDGAKGAKASGLLMVNRRLYMWVRNVGNAQLAWSDDHGRNWTWGPKIVQGFGSPSFLNFGPDYAGARDRFVYTYSQDGDSAYESDNGLALMRAPADRLEDSTSWEYFIGLDNSGRPQWSPRLEEREAVFRNPQRCQRVDAVFDRARRRYLLAVGFNHNSGWGLYEAPAPWGPWTTLFETEHWDIEGAHGYRLPAKWLEPDGQGLTLVFSAVHGRNTPDYDAFCARRVRLKPR